MFQYEVVAVTYIEGKSEKTVKIYRYVNTRTVMWKIL